MAPFCLPYFRKWLTRSTRRMVSVFQRLRRLLRDKDHSFPSVVTPFRLLDLPDIPLRRCLMHPESVKVAFCSGRAYRIVKSMHLPVTSIEVTFSPYNHTVKVFYEKKTDQVQLYKAVLILSSNSLSKCPKSGCVEKVDDVAAKLADLFHIPVRFYTVNTSCVPDIVEFVSSRLSILEVLEVDYWSELSCPQFDSLLKQMVNKSILNVKCKIPAPIATSDSQTEPPRWHFSMRSFYLHDSEWISEDNFEISVNCQGFALYNSTNSTLRAISKIIKDWQLGMYPKLMVIYLKDCKYNISPESVISDPSEVWTDRAPPKFAPCTNSLSGGVRFGTRYLALKRHDGEEAVVVHCRGRCGYRQLGFETLDYCLDV